ncbi:MAG: DUF4145 domain-containing protein [Dehalococcoidia bacterium]|nr:DUF4145 domain-containing protein [Dehalococcoidia bacterium]
MHTQRYLGESYSVDGNLIGDDTPSAYYVVVCETCGEILVYHAEFEFVSEAEFAAATLLWPDPGILHGSVPQVVAGCYAEAQRIKHSAPNAFATQIRRALEAVCDDRKAKKGNLQKRLLDMANKGEIPPVLSKMTDVLRVLGNAGAHNITKGVKSIQVRGIEEFFRAVVEYVYVAPSKLKEFEETMRFLDAKDTSK